MSNIAAVATKFLRHRFSRIHPYEVQAEITTACNLRCSYCRCPDLNAESMTTAEWVALIEQLGRAGTMRIKFQGGEPTIHRGFREFGAAAKAAGIVSAVVTNGIAIARHPELLDVVDEVVVSVDAPTAERHDRQRGVGTHSLAVRAIDEARARGRRVFVNMVVTTETLSDVEAMLAFCEARSIGFNAQPAMFTQYYQDPSVQHLGLSPEAHAAFQRQLAAWARQGRPVMFSPESYEHAENWSPYPLQTTASVGPSTCMAGRFYIHIAANGDVHPCNLHAPPFTPKNVRLDGFEQAVFHARNHECGDCLLPYLNERKALFALRPHAVMAWMRRA